MASGLSGMELGPSMDWTENSSLHHRYKEWKRSLQTLFEGPLHEVEEKVQCRYLRFWSGNRGMDLVDKWKLSKQLGGETGKDEDKLKSYWDLFEAYITPKTNALIAIVELKRLFQNNMSLEDFHTKAVMLVSQAGYPNPDRMVRDTLIAGISCSKTLEQILKVGTDITVERVLEIARNQLATSRSMRTMTGKENCMSINFVKRSKKKHQSSSATSHTKGNTFQKSSNASKCMRCGRGKHQDGQKCPAYNETCRGCGIKGHFHKVCLKSKKASTHAVETSKEPDYFDEHGNGIFVGMVQGRNTSKRESFIKFPCGRTHKDPMEQFLTLKLDTGADVNCMNEDTFHKLFPQTKLMPTPLEMDAYGESNIKVLGRFHAFLRWKGSIYRQVFYVTNANTSPNLLCRDACYTMGILIPCYEVRQKGQVPPPAAMELHGLQRLRWSQNEAQGPIFKSHPPQTAAIQNEAAETCQNEGPIRRPTAPVTTKVARISETKGTNLKSPKGSIGTVPNREENGSRVLKICSDTQMGPRNNPSNLDIYTVTQSSKNGHGTDPNGTGTQTKGTVLSNLSSIKPESVQNSPLTKQRILETYKDVFTGLGKFPGDPYKFHLKPDAKPARHAPRKVPIHLQDAFKAELDSLVEQGVLEPVEHSTEWVNSFVIVEKEVRLDSGNTHSPKHSVSKKLRICLDPRDLNEALQREPYYTRSIEELFGKFHGMEFFTIGDFSKSYWMVVLHPDSRKLTCMATEFGRFQWTRLPMGTVVAQDIFQRKLDGIFLNQPGIIGIADDMTISGKTQQEHDVNFLKFMELCRKHNLKLNPDKIQFKLPKVSFFGYTWSSSGLEPDSSKLEAIHKMSFPQDKETMRSFLGMVNFMNRFSPALAHIASSLRELTHQHVDYKPIGKHMEAFQATKVELNKKVVLPFFDPKAHTILQTDASKKGLGAVLIQNGTPIHFASRALTKTEQNYQNLERETLGTIWGMEKFHYFIYGKEFTLETDQKPLVSIYKKHMVEISPRVQRLILRSLPYQPFHVVYKPGVEIPLADALSRVSPSREEIGNIQLPIIAVNMIISSLPDTMSSNLQEIRNESGKDPVHLQLRSYIDRGWPDERRSVPQEIRPYWNYRDSLSVEDGIITKGNRILVPDTLKRKYMELIHEGHQGREKCLLKARECIYWNGITSDIAQLVEKCGTCQTNSQMKSSTLEQKSEIPPFPWHTLATDLFYWNKRDFLVLGDFYSKMIFVRKLSNSTSFAVVAEIAMIITELGPPLVIRSDNGPCYSSIQFQEFCKNFGIQHTTSSPHYPQSNGFAEALVKISKKLMEKAMASGKPWNTALLEYRITPISGTIPSPLELLTGRKPRQLLPQMPSIIGKSSNAAEYRDALMERHGCSKEVPYKEDFQVGDTVYVKDIHGKGWIPAVVDQPDSSPFSYHVKLQDGSILRRTRTALKARPTPSELEYNMLKRDWNSSNPVPNNLELPEVINRVSQDDIRPARKEETDPPPIGTIPTPAPAVEIPTLRRSTRVGKGTHPPRYGQE